MNNRLATKCSVIDWSLTALISHRFQYRHYTNQTIPNHTKEKQLLKGTFHNANFIQSIKTASEDPEAPDSFTSVACCRLLLNETLTVFTSRSFNPENFSSTRPLMKGTWSPYIRPQGPFSVSGRISSAQLSWRMLL